MVLSGRLISAKHALSIQLIDRLVEDETAHAAMREEISVQRIADHTEDAESIEAALAQQSQNIAIAPLRRIHLRHFRLSVIFSKAGDWQKLVQNKARYFCSPVAGERQVFI